VNVRNVHNHFEIFPSDFEIFIKNFEIFGKILTKSVRGGSCCRPASQILWPASL
jgi:hypothetical protein